MSLEAKIEALTAAVSQLTAVLQSQGAQVTTVAAPVAAAPAYTQVAAPAAMVAAPAPVPMPALPTFTAAAPVAAAPVAAAPFADAQGLMQYTMGAYQAMGAEKGARIQGVLQQLGYANINDIKPEHYGAFYAGVEALKGGA